MIDEHSLTYAPSDGGDMVVVDGTKQIQVISQIKPLDGNSNFRYCFFFYIPLCYLRRSFITCFYRFSCRIYVNEENLLIFEIDENLQIQYYRGNILTLKVTSRIKSSLCGLCNLPFNRGEDYALCQ